MEVVVEKLHCGMPCVIRCDIPVEIIMISLRDYSEWDVIYSINSDVIQLSYPIETYGEVELQVTSIDNNTCKWTMVFDLIHCDPQIQLSHSLCEDHAEQGSVFNAVVSFEVPLFRNITPQLSTLSLWWRPTVKESNVSFISSATEADWTKGTVTISGLIVSICPGVYNLKITCGHMRYVSKAIRIVAKPMYPAAVIFSSDFPKVLSFGSDIRISCEVVDFEGRLVKHHPTICISLIQKTGISEYHIKDIFTKSGLAVFQGISLQPGVHRFKVRSTTIKGSMSLPVICEERIEIISASPRKSRRPSELLGDVALACLSHDECTARTYITRIEQLNHIQLSSDNSISSIAEQESTHRNALTKLLSSNQRVCSAKAFKCLQRQQAKERQLICVAMEKRSIITRCLFKNRNIIAEERETRIKLMNSFTYRCWLFNAKQISDQTVEHLRNEYEKAFFMVEESCRKTVVNHYDGGIANLLSAKSFRCLSTQPNRNTITAPQLEVKPNGNYLKSMKGITTDDNNKELIIPRRNSSPETLRARASSFATKKSKLPILRSLNSLGNLLQGRRKSSISDSLITLPIPPNGFLQNGVRRLSTDCEIQHVTHSTNTKVFVTNSHDWLSRYQNASPAKSSSSSQGISDDSYSSHPFGASLVE